MNIYMASKNNKSNNNLFTNEELVSSYRMMLLIRRFEERCGQLYGMGLIGGFCHLYIGQEAVIAGINSALPGYPMITAYRDHGHIIAVGEEPKVVMAELLGRSTGVSRGKGGSMHLFSTKNKFYGGHGIVGAQVSIGTGLGFAEKYNGTGKIAIVFMGDGAANQGQVYESFNMASLWGLPVLYIIENNEYAMGTSVARASSTSEFYKRGIGFGIEGKRVNGMDLFEVKQATLDAAEYIRTNNKPYILEMKTYRYRGHSMSDPAKYRSKEEVEQYRTQHDPLDFVAKYLEDNKISTKSKLEKLDEEVSAIVMDAVEFAKNSPEPEDAELYTNVFA